jgi:hypothetical protein
MWQLEPIQSACDVGLKTIDRLVEEIGAIAKPVEGSAIAQVANRLRWQ